MLEAIAIFFPLFLMLFVLVFVTKRGKKLTKQEIDKIIKKKYPTSSKVFYFISIIFIVIGIMIGGFVPFYLLFSSASLDNTEIVNIARYYLCLFLMIGNIALFTFIIDSIFYKFSSKIQKEFILYTQIKTGFPFTIQTGFSIMIKLAAIYYLIAIVVFIISLAFNIL